MKISIYLTIGLVVVGIFLGITIGYYFTPEYQASMYDKSAVGAPDGDLK